MSSKIDKAMLKSPDMFISTSDKVFEFVERHFMSFIGALAVILVGSVVYVTYNYINSAREEAAAEALYPAEAQLRKIETDFAEARAKQPKNSTESVATPDYAKNYASSVEKVKAVLRLYSTRKVAMVSGLNLSYFLVQQKQFPEALEVLNLIKYEPKVGDGLYGFWQMHRGLALLENNQADAAIDAYQKVLSSEALKPFHPEALLKLGVSLDLKGDSTKARETFERLGREFPETEASASAQQYLRLMSLKTQKQG